MGSLLSENPITSPPRRRRTRRLKDLGALYDSPGAALHSNFQQRTSEEEIPYVANQVKLEPEYHRDDSINGKHTNNDDDKECNSDSDDLSIECMTLKNLQERVKVKKRRIPKTVVSPSADLKDNETKPEEKDSDLEESLFSLKSKLSKVPSTRKRQKKLESHSSNAVQVSKLTNNISTKTDARLLELSAAGITEENFGAPAKKNSMNTDNSLISSVRNVRSDANICDVFSSVKSEKVVPVSMDGQSKDDISSVSEVVNTNNFLRCSSEPLQNIIEEEFESRKSRCPTDRLLHSDADGHVKMDVDSCSLSSLSELKGTLHGNFQLVYSKHGNFKIITSGENTVHDDVSCDVNFGVNHGYPEDRFAGEYEKVNGTPQGQSGESNDFVGSSLCRYIAKIHLDNVEPDKATLTPTSGADNIGELREVFVSELSSHQTSSLPASSRCNISSSDASSIVSISPVMDLDSDLLSKENRNAFLYGEESDERDVSRSSMEVECLTDLVHKSSANERLNISAESLSSLVEPVPNGFPDTTSCATEINSQFDSEIFAQALHCNSQISPSSLSAVNGSHSDSNGSNAAAEVLSPAADKNLDTIVDSSISKSSGTSYSVGMSRCNTSKKVRNHPRKILSKRKIFSPDCQEKLRHALTDTTKYSEHGEAVAAMRVDMPINKPKINWNASPHSVPKGILKSPDASCKTPGSGNKSSLVQNQTEETIKFSLRQMQDIKTIASKLLKGLKCMKNIVEETQCSEACHLVPPKFSAEEIRMAVGEASELEVTTNKWLSIMSKDCNRFCKILRTENKSASAISSEKRKKLTFADEAGGMLCHVKVFEQELSAVSESNQLDDNDNAVYMSV